MPKPYKVIVPLELEARLGDKLDMVQRWRFAVPQGFEEVGMHLDKYKEQHFVLVGPFEGETEVARAIKTFNEQNKALKKKGGK